MKGAAANDEKFLSVMFNLSNAMKSESEYCCKICGGLNEKELFIIAFIGENRSVKMSAIADYLQVPLSTLTTIVDKLVTNKFLLRYNSNHDRRVVKVELDQKRVRFIRSIQKSQRNPGKKGIRTFEQSGPGKAYY